MRKIISFIIIISILATTGISIAAPSTWASDEVEMARQLGLVPSGLLSNYQSHITREEFSEMVVKLYEELSVSIAVPVSTNPFTDTSNPEILKAYKLGIVEGVGQGKFAPLDKITREQIATMYYRTLYAADPTLVTGSYTLGFADRGLVSNWAADEVAFMSAKGVIQGKGSNIFDPKGNTTREEAIALTVRTYQQFSKNPQTPVTSLPGGKLTSEQIGALSDSVVQIFIEQYDGTYNTGSAFFYDKGRLATNFHVIENAKSITMEYEDGSTYTGGITVTGYDRELDLATLMVSDISTPPLKLGDSSTVVKGQRVYAIGSPVGLTNSLSDGLVSAVRSDMIQVTTAINPGNSGGVLLDEYGRVIGITFARITDGDNLGFAIPINLLKSMNKDRVLSIKQFNDEISLTLEDGSNEISNYKIIDHLFDNMQSIVANGVEISFDGYDVVKKTDTLTKIFAYIDEENLDKFLASEKAGITNIAKILKVHAVFYEEIIGTNVNIEVIYYGVYDEYPRFFEENYLSEDTISYYGIWEVLYPLIEVSNNSNQFRSWYGSHTL
ncbi:trypsin-like peptidase domain-containing protein [Gudongella oleilytica]|uniref:trypsin-like peptidase domain-containing protein n=1 Tax=Gudongella oleilytica TaxID=1582259 RepID=UPI0013E8B699|nr:trypsin-like peptidase domain-containing protein [Gudongella oleilytica]